MSSWSGREESSPAISSPRTSVSAAAMSAGTGSTCSAISDQHHSKALPVVELNGVPVDFHIWDIRRLFQVSSP